MIPDETDPRSPAPRALAPREPEGRGPRPPVVGPPPVWRWDRWSSGAANPAKRLRALGVTWQALDPWKFEVPVQIGWGPLSRSPSTVGHLAFNQTCVGSNPTRLTPDA